MLLTLRSAILTTLAADPRMAGTNLYSHGGDFDFNELLAYGRKTPAAILSIMQARAHLEGGLPTCNVGCRLALIAKDTPGVKRDVKVLRMVDAVLNILVRFPNQRWGLEDEVQNPQDVDSMNLYNKKFDPEGIAIWGVSWRQAIELKPTDEALEEELPFETFAAKWDLYPRANDAPIGTPADPQPDDAVIDAEDSVDVDQS